MDQFHHHSAKSACQPITSATHCVFRRGSCWLALPAMAVREAMPRPEMVSVPGTPQTFAGLCHVRSEFIPVLNLDSVLPDSDQLDGSVLLVLDDSDGPWAVLVDEVTSLRTLVVSDAPLADISDTSCVIVGWATLGNQVIQLLDPCRLRTLAEQELDAMWHPANAMPGEYAVRST